MPACEVEQRASIGAPSSHLGSIDERMRENSMRRLRLRASAPETISFSSSTPPPSLLLSLLPPRDKLWLEVGRFCPSFVTPSLPFLSPGAIIVICMFCVSLPSSPSSPSAPRIASSSSSPISGDDTKKSDGGTSERRSERRREESDAINAAIMAFLSGLRERTSGGSAKTLSLCQ